MTTHHYHVHFYDFDPSKHPHAPEGAAQSKGGQFVETKSGGSGTNQTKPSVGTPPRKGKKSAHLVLVPRDKWPDHIKSMKPPVPPAWTNVHISLDPDIPLQVLGQDSKGKWQPRYTEAYKASNAAKKWARIKKLDAKFNEMLEQNRGNIKSEDKKKSEHAQVAALVFEMGLRPGSETDTGAQKKAYGATTLLAEHVVQTPNGVRLQFVGKSGKSLDFEVTDKVLAQELVRRSKTQGQLFPTVDDRSLREYVSTLDGGGFKTKDLRTLKATRLATALVARQTKPPTNMAEYKKMTKAIAANVSQSLGNTPTVCLQSYISPVVFAEWLGRLQPEKTKDAVSVEQVEPKVYPELADDPFGTGPTKDLPETDDGDDDSDEELKKTPQDVIDLLGYDPLEDEDKK